MKITKQPVTIAADELETVFEALQAEWLKAATPHKQMLAGVLDRIAASLGYAPPDEEVLEAERMEVFVHQVAA